MSATGQTEIPTDHDSSAPAGLGRHWASGVLGGYALGAAYLLLLLEAYRWLGLPDAPPSGPARAPTPSTA